MYQTTSLMQKKFIGEQLEINMKSRALISITSVGTELAESVDEEGKEKKVTYHVLTKGKNAGFFFFFFTEDHLQRKSWQPVHCVRNNFNTSVCFDYLRFPTVLSREKSVEFKSLPNGKQSKFTTLEEEDRGEGILKCP